MFSITIPRADVTSDEVADALRQGLGSRYEVLPGTGVNCWNPVSGPRPDHPDTIVVGTGSTRLSRAQVRISHDAGETILHVSPGGFGLLSNPSGFSMKALLTAGCQSRRRRRGEPA